MNDGVFVNLLKNIVKAFIKEELEEIDRQLILLKIEKQAIQNEKDESSIKRLKQLDFDLELLGKKSDKLNTIWNSQKQRQ